MKKIFIVFISALAFTLNAQAQKKSGAIQYETVIDPAAMAEASGITLNEQMKARMPKSIKANYELLYNANNASFMAVTDTEDSNSGGGQGRMMMRMGGFAGIGKEYFYTFADQKMVEVSTLMDTVYAVPGKLDVSVLAPAMGRNNAQSNSAVQFLPGDPTVEIIKSDETKKILNLDCKKVVIKTTRKAKVLDMDKDIIDETTLWYTTDLGFNFSPEPNLWTEGTVLAIEKRGGGTSAKSIEFRSVSAKDVTAPKKAIAISAEEFKAKQASMVNRFRNNARPGQTGGATRIVIN